MKAVSSTRRDSAHLPPSGFSGSGSDPTVAAKPSILLFFTSCWPASAPRPTPLVQIFRREKIKPHALNGVGPHRMKVATIKRGSSRMCQINVAVICHACDLTITNGGYTRKVSPNRLDRDDASVMIASGYCMPNGNKYWNNQNPESADHTLLTDTLRNDKL